MQQTTQTTAPRPAPPKPPAEFEERAIATMDAAGLIRILSDASSSEFQKAKAGQRLGELGAKEAVPVLSGLLGNEHLSTYARHGLETVTDPSAAEALRSALPKLKGIQLIGVINSIGKRRDPKAGPALAKLLYNADQDVARAAAAAIGSIGAPSSVKELQSALSKTSGLTKVAVADACLICAERLLAAGERDHAMKMYAFLSAPEIPKAARLGAMSAIIREETRPR